MTMRVTITNGDAQRTALVLEKDESGPDSETYLGPGLTQDFWIHSTKTLTVTEEPEG